MTSRKTHSAWRAGLCGAASAILLIAAWVTVAALWRSPVTRIAAFIDPWTIHRVHASTGMLEFGIGVLTGLAVSLLFARALRSERLLACVFFLVGFAAVCVIPMSLHEGWLRAHKVLADPLLMAFVVAVVAGFAIAWRTTGPRKPMPQSRA